jgi:uncharacterized protein (DUF1810 family)
VKDPYNLERFVEAQDRHGFDTALDEIRKGRKVTHWIWWVFPQLAGLAFSDISREYAISSRDEAAAFLLHPVLGTRLREATAAMNSHLDSRADSILDGDDVKFRSSMTLFMRAAPQESLFQNAIDIFFNGVPDSRTDQLLKHDT